MAFSVSDIGKRVILDCSEDDDTIDKRLGIVVRYFKEGDTIMEYVSIEGISSVMSVYDPSKIIKIDEANTYYGLSTDTKPTGVENGSVFYEMDKTTVDGVTKQRVYMYSTSTNTWIEQG